MPKENSEQYSTVQLHPMQATVSESVLRFSQRGEWGQMVQRARTHKDEVKEEDPLQWMVALHLCAWLGAPADVVKTLVNECGAELDVTNPAGLTPLMIAVLHGHKDTTQALVQLGA